MASESVPSSLLIPNTHRKCSMDDAYLTVSGSFIGSVMSARCKGIHRPSLSLHSTPSESTEQKLNRTRKMSEAIQSPIMGLVTPKINPIPTEMGDINREWVKVVTDQYYLKQDSEIMKNGSIDVLDYQITNCKRSSGDFSCTYKIEVYVSLENKGKERINFIAKLLPYEDIGRVYVFENNLLEKEIEVYFEVLPSIRQFLRNQQSGDQSDIIESAIPECIYASHNLDGAGTLVFRSCEDSGFEHCTDPMGFSLEELFTTIKTMAKIHATGRCLIEKNDIETVKKRYPYLINDMYSNGMLMAEVNEQIETYKDLLDHSGTIREASDNVLKKLESISPLTLTKELRRQGPASLNTIIHGELWEKNILFRSSDTKCKILDWKNAKIASATLDIAFLLFSSANHEIISNCWEKVLAEYHKVFCDTLDNLEPKCSKPSYEELKLDYIQSVNVALSQAICMFVQEMEYLERLTSDKALNDADESVKIANKLKIYERRAIDLLMAVDLDLLEKNESSDLDNIEDTNRGRSGSGEFEFGEF